jgi:hypothetical protein
MVSTFQWKLVLYIAAGKHPVLLLRAHDLDTVVYGCPDAERYAVDPPFSQEGLRRKLEILQAKRFGAGYEVFADGASAAHYAETDPELVMFVEEGAGFELLMMANENGSHSPILGVCSDEIPRVRYEVFLLTATQAKVVNCWDKAAQVSLTDYDLSGSLAAVEGGANRLFRRGRKIRRCLINNE